MAKFVCCFNLFLVVLALCTLQGNANFFNDDKVIVTTPPTTRQPTRPPVNNIYVQFSQEQYMVDETAGYALLKVTVSGHRTFAISVNAKIFVSSKFKPRAASSYDVSTGVKRLTFRPGVNTLILRVRIYDDKRVEGTEAFGVQLIVPDYHIKNGLKLGRPSLATVFIKDNERSAIRPPSTTRPPTKGTHSPTTKPFTTHPPTHPTTHPTIKPPTPTGQPMSVKVAFEFGRYSVRESCTMLSVTLVVMGKVTQPFTVTVIPVDFRYPSAIAGKDFDPKPLHVHFQPGQSYASVCIVIMDDDIREGFEKFRLILSIPRSVRAVGVWPKYPYFADVLIKDDSDDGRGLPIQFPPTDIERAKMCICKPHPTPTPTPPIGFSVMFNDSRYSGCEADEVIAVTIVATGVSSKPYNVTVIPSELVPPNATEVLDFSNETIEVTFNPGETEQTVLVAINPDCIREGLELFNLSLSLDYDAKALGITLGDPSTAVGVIEDTDIIFVSLNSTLYFADESDEMMLITVEADGVSSSPYFVQIFPGETFIPDAAQGNGVDFISDTLIATFNPGDTEAVVSLPIIVDQIPEPFEVLNLFLGIPDKFSDVNGKFLVKFGSIRMASGIIRANNT